MYTSRVKRPIAYFIFTLTWLAAALLPSRDGILSVSDSVIWPAHAGRNYLREFQAETPILPNQELRVAWIVRHALVSKSEIDRAIDFAVGARFQLLFVQVRGRADAYYRSDLEPPGSDIETSVDDFDPLAYLLTRAHAADISVHAWVNVCYVWSDPDEKPPPNHILNTHPEWLMGSDDGRRMDALSVLEWKQRGLEGYFVSPALPEMRRHTAAVIKDIVTRYPVDGVHLDYIRYPGVGFGFNKYERTAFALRYGIDPLRLRNGRYEVEDMVGERAAHMLDSLHVEWRVAQVDSVVRSVREAIGDLPLSAAVIPEFGRARVEKGQDWLGWIRRGDVDFVVPMAYTYEPGDLVDQIRMIQRIVGSDRFLVGLPVFDGRDAYLGYSVSLLRQEGVIGYSLFSYNALAEERFALRFLERIFFEPFLSNSE